jgi:hypothetical protein
MCEFVTLSTQASRRIRRQARLCRWRREDGTTGQSQPALNSARNSRPFCDSSLIPPRHGWQRRPERGVATVKRTGGRIDEWLRGEVTADKRPPVPIDDAFKRACGASSPRGQPRSVTREVVLLEGASRAVHRRRSGLARSAQTRDTYFRGCSEITAGGACRPITLDGGYWSSRQCAIAHKARTALLWDGPLGRSMFA